MRYLREALREQGEALREQNARFELVLEKIRQGVCVFDGAQRLISANARHAEIYRIPPEAIRPGMALREIVDLRFAAGSGPAMTPEAYLQWRESEHVDNGAVDSIVELADGRVIRVHREHTPENGWIATHEDVTHQRRSEAELRERNLQFDAAISNMSQGLCMFNADEKVIVCNLNYCNMYGMSPEFVKPGVTLYEVLRHSVTIGAASEGVDELYRIRRQIIDAKQPATYCETLADGRIIDIWHRPMADGGWVSTYEDITERRRSEARIAYMATHDPLTGLANRSRLQERLSQSLLATNGADRVTALLMLDLDRFKEINDTLGHAPGDRLLRLVAERLRNLFGERALVARLGGDEFAILLAVACADEAAAHARRVIESLVSPYDLEGHKANVGVSIGISLAPRDGLDPEGLLRCADLALYRAKARGRGGFAFFESEMTDSARRRRSLEMELREALVRGQFEIHYQPQVNLKTGLAGGAEALIRWRHPARGIVGPGEFIGIAEEVGLIAPIGEWIMRQACADAARWKDGARVAVNISAVQFRNDHLAEMVVSALSAAGLAPSRLEIEITESVLLEKTEATLRALHQLRALGVRVALDDFGTGYSSLSYLRSFPFDKIKIDRSFTLEAGAGANGAAIVRAIASLGASFGMETTAEGVETEAQLALVTKEGCTEAQGFYFSEPRPASELAEWLGADGPGARRWAV